MRATNKSKVKFIQREIILSCYFYRFFFLFNKWSTDVNKSAQNKLQNRRKFFKKSKSQHKQQPEEIIKLNGWVKAEQKKGRKKPKQT